MIPDRLNLMTKIIGGRYQIVEHLGGGGFGQTFLARDIHLPDNPYCVVKLLMPLGSQNPQFTSLPKESDIFQLAHRLFCTEAQALYKLGEHDRIPKLLAHFEENREFYLVQQLIEGHDLRQEIISGQRWDEAKVIDLLLDILTPLAFVHQQNVIHRDLKPANLIRRKQDGKIVLIDFGAVKQKMSETTSSQGNSLLSVSIGTLGYMSNEQCNGRPTFSSDVYSVGIIAIQALTGLDIQPNGLPYARDTGEIVWRDSAEVSPKLADILDKMVRYDFRQRYRSAQEALQAILELQNHNEHNKHTIKPRATTTVLIDNCQKIPIERKSLVRLLIIILAILIGGVIFSFILNIGSPENKTLPQKEIPAF
jgi:serine/threonine protein kinase